MRCFLPIGLVAAVLCQVAGDDLLLVQAVWRHGDRTPTTTFPTDTNKDWPQGWGQLTTLGMQQHYALGTRLRGMYTIDLPFINSTYKAGEIYIRSTDVDRTLMSAMSNLAGFYPNGVNGVTFPDANDVPSWPSSWSPVPIHTVEYATDLIGYPLAYCPRADQLYDQIRAGASYKNMTAVNQQFLDWLTTVTGSTSPVTLDNIWEVHDSLFIEKVHNRTIPTWCNDTVYARIDDLNNAADNFLLGIGSPRDCDLIKLRGGSLLKDIIHRMNTKIACIGNMTSSCTSTNRLKYYVYSAHDVTVAALLATFGDEFEVVGGGLPNYAASIVLELWNTTSGPQVKILYHKEFNTSYYPITNLTQGCLSNSVYCPLSQFVNRSQIFLPGNINVDCQAQTTTTTPPTTPTTTPPTTHSAAISINVWSASTVQIFFIAFALLFGAIRPPSSQ